MFFLGSTVELTVSSQERGFGSNHSVFLKAHTPQHTMGRWESRMPDLRDRVHTLQHTRLVIRGDREAHFPPFSVPKHHSTFSLLLVRTACAPVVTTSIRQKFPPSLCISMCRTCRAIAPRLPYLVDRSEWYWDISFFLRPLNAHCFRPCRSSDADFRTTVSLLGPNAARRCKINTEDAK